MRKAVWMLVLGLFVMVGTAQAHCGKCGIGDGPKEEDMKAMMQEKMDKMTADLGLSDDQKSQLETIMTEKMDKKKAIMDEKHAAMEALHEDFKAKLKGVLTEEQMAKWEAKKEEMGDMKGKCPMCEKAGEGKLCPMCKMHKGEKGEKGGEGHGHDHKADKK